MLQKIASFIFMKREKGQSLVEVAIAFPIFLIILAGVVEVSHLAITQNRISNAARAASRFSSQGGAREEAHVIALNSVTQTLELTNDVWDLWTIEGQVDDSATDFVEWSFQHSYGLGQTEEFSSVNEANIKQQVLDELRFDDPSGAENIQFVGTYIIHDVESILGIQAIPNLLGYNSVRGLNVMRLLPSAQDETGSCTAFPIAVEEGIRSVQPPGTGTGNDYPDASDFHPSSPKPDYYDDGFNETNVPDTPLEDAQEGYIYKVQNGDGPGNFGWLVWNNGINASATTLQGSLTWPGDAIDYEDHNDGGQPATPLYPHVVRGYVNPADTTDLGMNIGDWVTVSTGSINSGPGRAIINEHIAKGRYLRLLVWGIDNNTTPWPQSPHTEQGTTYYVIKGFAWFKIHGHNLSQGAGTSWILAEFDRWATECGQ